MSESMSTPATSTSNTQPPDAMPPPTNRRPRVREVSSRFMNTTTPVTGGEHLTLQQQQQQQPHKTPKHTVSTPMPVQKTMMQRSKTDNPYHHHHHQETVIRRSYSDSPLTLHNFNKVPPTRHRGASTRLVFKENRGVRLGEGSDNDDDSNDGVAQLRMGKLNSSRQDTPATQRIVPSRFRQSGNSNLMSGSAAAKLLQSSGLSLSSVPQEHIGDAKGTGSNCEDDEDGCSTKSCPNSPIPIQNNNLQWNSNVRSSMPERTCFSSNNVSESQLSSKLISASPCSRSLNLVNSSVKMMGFNQSLPPPHPMALTKQGDAARKGKKLFNREEQVHSLKMLHNQYLQWNFVNAKSQTSFRAQTRDAEGKFYSIGAKISDLSVVVRRKRMELEYLKRLKTLTTIVETQTPYLDEWSALEEEHSSSLSGTTQALVNSLVRLPVGGNVQADVKEVGEALNSAMKVMEMIYGHVRKFIPKASEIDTLSSELARSASGERVRIEECGDLLLKTYTLQVEDCSLRGHLMQLKKSNLLQQ